MKWTRNVALAIPALALLWTAYAAAQPPGRGGHPPGAFGPGGPMGFFGGPGGPEGKRVVEGAPYQAQFSTETVQTLGDGNRIVRRATGTVARDGAGRVRREHAMPGNGKEARRMTAIDDPVADVHYMLFADRKVAHKMPGRHPGEVFERPRHEMGDRPGRADAREGDRPAPKTESLGKRTIAGVEAEGTRETVAIPAGAFGNEKAVEIVSEKWYSPELQIVVEGRHRDPLHGDSTYTVTGITRGEPDASLFEVPAGYSIEDGPGPDHHAGPGGGPRPPQR